MYIPNRFLETDREAILSFIEQNSFATLVSDDGAKPVATHIPLIVENVGDKIYLCGHFARANSQWKTFAGEREILAVFTGAHAYISPRWYPAPEENVPTWNYQAVHVYGKPQIIEEKSALVDLLWRLIEKYEPQTGYDRQRLSPEVIDNLIGGIVGFRFEAARFEAAFKLSQHRPEFHAGIIAGLSENGDENSLAVAAAIKKLGRAARF